jgi:hypothetical protein
MAGEEAVEFEIDSGADVMSQVPTVTTSRSSDSATSLASELSRQQARLAPNSAAAADNKVCAVIKCQEKKNGKRSKYCKGHGSAHECIQRQHFPRMSL